MTSQTSLKDFGYEEIKVIGRGQYGKAHLVKKAQADGQGDIFEIAKTIDLTCLSERERGTALQEVALLRRLDHPNIVEYRDNFFMVDTLVIIMQYCEGGDLQTFIKDRQKKKDRIAEKKIMNYFVQVLHALQYIHGERILHRDLKTSNLFLMASKSVVKLGDFGISRVLEGSIEAAMTVVGTPYYMSPEVCENKPYTFKSDVWSLGCVLYELCMLKHAFAADNLLGLVYKIVSDKYEPIPMEYSQNLNGLIQRMLDKNADKRMSVRELLADQYVHNYVSEYVRTKGQCAMPATVSSARHAPGKGGGRGTSSASGASRAGGHHGGAASANAGPAAGGERPPPKPRIPRQAAPGAGRPHSTPSAGGSAKAETPKEAADRRKREATEKRERELSEAAQKTWRSTTQVARQRKDAEFRTTRLGPTTPGGSSAAAAPMHAATGPVDFHSPMESPSQAASTATGVPDGHGCGEEYSDSADGYGPEEDDCSESPESTMEDICEGESDYDDEEYESDFEESDGEEHIRNRIESDVEEDIALHTLGAGREEQDFSRVMCNYEQDLARAGSGGGISPLQRRPSSDNVKSVTGGAGAAPYLGSAPSSGSLGPQAASGTVKPGGAIMDMRLRASRLREELMRKMGPDMFQKAFDYLTQARSRNVDERTVKRELEALVGREIYKNYCFDVDQLVFQQLLYS